MFVEIAPLGLDPDMEIRNHLNQPRELVKGTPVIGLWSASALAA